MAATATAVGTGLLTAYGIANDVGANPANPLTQAATAVKDNVQLNAFKLQLQTARAQLAQFEVEKLKERAERLKEEIQMYASEQGPQTGGARGGTPADVELLKTQLRSLGNDILGSKMTSSDKTTYGKTVDDLLGYVETDDFKKHPDLYRLYSNYKQYLMSYLRNPTDSKFVDTKWKDIQMRRARYASEDNPVASLPSPATTLATEPTPPSPPPAPPAPPAPSGPTTLFSTGPIQPPPGPTTLFSTGPIQPPPDTSITGVLTTAATDALGAIAGPKTPIKGLDKLLNRIDTQVLKDLTIENWKGKADTLREIEKAFRDLREARKKNEPFDDRALKEKVDHLLTGVEAHWPILSASLATTTPELVKRYFDLLYAVRTLKGEIGEQDTTELNDRYIALETEFVAIQAATAPAAPTPAPAPVEPPVPEPPAPGPPAPGPPAPAPAPEPPAPGPPAPEPPAPEPGGGTGLVPETREIPHWLTADMLKLENENMLIDELRNISNVEDLDQRVADYRQLAQRNLDGEDYNDAMARLDRIYRVRKNILEHGLAPAPVPTPAPTPVPAPAPTPADEEELARLSAEVDERERIKTLLKEPGATASKVIAEVAGPDANLQQKLAAANLVNEEVQKMVPEALRNKKQTFPRPPGKSVLRRSARGGPPGGPVTAGTDMGEVRKVLEGSPPAQQAPGVLSGFTGEVRPFEQENPMRAQLQPGGPLPGGTGAGAYGSPTATNVFQAQVTPRGSTAGTVRRTPEGKRKVNLDGGRRTLRKKRLTPRRGKKTNGK